VLSLLVAGSYGATGSVEARAMEQSHGGCCKMGTHLRRLLALGKNRNMCGQLKLSVGLVAVWVVIGQHWMGVKCQIVGSVGMNSKE